MSGLLIAFEGLDQSGKQTQAELLRDRLTSDGRPVRLLSFPDYRDRDRRRDRSRRCAASANTRPTSCSCCTSQTATSGSREIVREMDAGDDPRLRSLPGVEHRIRRGAGARRRVAAPNPEVPAAARHHVPARHRAGRLGATEDRRPRQVRARPVAARARPRQLSSPGVETGWMRLDAARAPEAVAADVWQAIVGRV